MIAVPSVRRPSRSSTRAAIVLMFDVATGVRPGARRGNDEMVEPPFYASALSASQIGAHCQAPSG